MATGTAPVFTDDPTDPTVATYNVSISFFGIVFDADGDILNVTWDWGDGTYNTSTTLPANPAKLIRGNHIYKPEIEQGRGWPSYPYFEFYNLTITLDDGNGNLVSDNTQVKVTMPVNGLPVMPSIYLNGTSSSMLDPTDVVYVVANSSDPEGESLTWTYIFKDSVGAVYRTAVVNTPATDDNQNVWVNISHSFGTVGRHQIDVYVSDALLPYQTYPHNRTNTIFVDVVVNSIPSVGTINVDPNTPIVNSTIGYRIVNFTLDASDTDGDVLTVTWDFDDGTPVVVNTSAGGTAVFRSFQSRNYTDEGVFNITVVVTDGKVGHEVYKFTIVNVSSTNLPPRIVSFGPSSPMSGGTWAEPNETIEFLLAVTDPEMDEVEIFLNWGDGSEVLHFFLSEYVNGNASILLNHSYATRGNFTITLNYSDNKIGILTHDKSYSLTIETRTFFEHVAEGWSWWDYTSLGMLFLIPIVLVVWAISTARQRRKLEDEGLTMDEWKLLQDKSFAESIDREKKV